MINNSKFWTSEIFFDRLNFFLNNRKWSLYQLCLSADISVDTLYKLRKYRRLPTLRTVCIICDALEISLPEFFIMPFAAKEYSIMLQKLKNFWAVRNSSLSARKRLILEVFLQMTICVRMRKEMVSSAGRGKVISG